MAAYSLNRPLAGHYPTVGRVSRGKSWNGATCYATTLNCSCGHRFTAGGLLGNVVTNLAPSQGGRAYATEAYRDHVADVLAPRCQSIGCEAAAATTRWHSYPAPAMLLCADHAAAFDLPVQHPTACWSRPLADGALPNVPR